MKLLNYSFLFLLLPKLAEAKVADEVVVYGSKVMPIFFGSLLLVSLFYTRTWFRQKIRDGWSWDKYAHRSVFFSLLGCGIFYHYWPEHLFPSVATHWWLLLESIFHVCATWSVTTLLLKLQFKDPYELRRHRPYKQKQNNIFLWLNDILCCGALFSLPWFSFSQDILVVLAAFLTARRIDWSYCFHRSRSRSFLYFTAIMLLGFTIPMHKESLLHVLSCWTLFLGLARLRSQLAAQREARALIKYCRHNMQEEKQGIEKLHALCSALQDEWALARVTVVSIQNREGLLLASAGPNALQSDPGEARKLGPLLRRLCSEANVLYSPVAGDLGEESISHQLRHSSLALPLLFKNEVVAAICLMADGEETIDRQESLVMEITINQLTDDILTATSIAIHERREQRILKLAKNSNGLLYEGINSSGKILSAQTQERLVVRAEVDCCNGILPNLEDRYRQDVWVYWSSLREVFEFLPFERKDACMWAISPSRFESPYLQTLGAETAGIILAELFARHAELVARDEGFRALNIRAAKILVGQGNIAENSPPFTPSIFLQMEKIARSPQMQFGDFFSYGLDGQSELYALKDITTDKKEIRKLESLAQSLAKDNRRAA
jgi:hypothetical protein